MKARYFILMILLLPVVFAYPYNELDQKAKQLRGVNDYSTVRNIDMFVEKEITHIDFPRPRGIYRTWDEKIGDCTDKAIIKRYLLQRNKIENRIVHGFVNRNKFHDWIEVRLNNKWQTPERERWRSMRKIGYGVW